MNEEQDKNDFDERSFFPMKEREKGRYQGQGQGNIEGIFRNGKFDVEYKVSKVKTFIKRANKSNPGIFFVNNNFFYRAAHGTGREIRSDLGQSVSIIRFNVDPSKQENGVAKQENQDTEKNLIFQLHNSTRKGRGSGQRQS